jgi:hypothetical protein
MDLIRCNKAKVKIYWSNRTNFNQRALTKRVNVKVHIIHW